MNIVGLLFHLLGGIGLFLFGMKTMSDGLQQSAGDRMRKALNLMTTNRFTGMLTGTAVTAIIQSSTAVTVMLITFVNAGLLTLTQSIGVIFGANIGTTMTAWIISILGFSIDISSLALPAVGVGFVFSALKWKHRHIGNFLLGFGFLFIGLAYLTQGMRNINLLFSFDAISTVRDMGFLSIIIGSAAGIVITVLLNSSSAATAIIMSMAFNDLISYEMAAGMVLGSNVGTTASTVIASLSASTAAKRSALVHVLFNSFGFIWALPLLVPLLRMIALVLPGDPWAASTVVNGVLVENVAIPIHLAGLHTVYNIINTALFLPFVDQAAKLVSRIIPEKIEDEKKVRQYSLEFRQGRSTHNTTEFNIIRAEKEIQDMAGIASKMYHNFSSVLISMQEKPISSEEMETLIEDLRIEENYADEMREQITAFLMECSRGQISNRSKGRIARLLRIIADLEDLTDDCYSASLILNQSVEKKLFFKKKEMTALVPYVALVSQFLDFLGNIKLGHTITKEQSEWALELENKIDKSRNKLRKLGRKRLEAGKNVRTELLFIDLVRRIEKLGDYCFSIVEELAK